MGGGTSRLKGSGGKFTAFGSHGEALQKSTKFFSDHSNSDTWHHGELTSEERSAIQEYTGTAYHSINSNLYKKKFDEIDSYTKNQILNIEKGINKFRLEKGIQVTRKADFKIFGAKSGEKMTVEQVRDFIKKNADPKDGTLENKGFLSSGANNHGKAIDGDGLVIRFKVPPSIGAGAYVNPISYVSGASENEWLFNSYSRFKFNLSSLRRGSDGRIYITAVWKGRTKH